MDNHPLLRGKVTRWVWMLYTQRFTRAGRWFIWPTVVLSCYGGISLRLQGYVLFSYIWSLWVVAAVCMLLLRPRVRLHAQHADRICAGETLAVEVHIEQAARLVGTELVLLPHRLPLGMRAQPEEGVSLPALRRGETLRMQVQLHCGRRGVYLLRGFRVESEFPFGLLRSRRVFAEERRLMVYPQFTRLARLQLPTGRRYHPGGVALASNIGESFEFIGDREYHEGDNVRDIDWRATARLDRPIVREYRDEYFLRVAVILDTYVPKGAAAKSQAFERAISLAAAVSDHMARQEYLVDLFAAGPNLYHLTAGRSLAYLDQILDILACVEENREEPFGLIEPEIMESLARITTVICIFLDWNDARRSFVHRLAQQGAGVKVIVVRDEPCTRDPLADADALGEIPIISGERSKAGVEEL